MKPNDVIFVVIIASFVRVMGRDTAFCRVSTDFMVSSSSERHMLWLVEISKRYVSRG